MFVFSMQFFRQLMVKRSLVSEGTALTTAPQLPAARLAVFHVQQFCPKLVLFQSYLPLPNAIIIQYLVSYSIHEKVFFISADLCISLKALFTQGQSCCTSPSTKVLHAIAIGSSQLKSGFRQKQCNIQKHVLYEGGQCDQMVRLFFQYFVIHKYENLPNSIKFTKVR